MSSAVQDDAVFNHDLDDDDSQSQDDDDEDLENDDVLAAEEDEDDLNFISHPTVVTPDPPVAVPSASLVTVAADPHKFAVEMSSAVLTEAKRQRTMAPEAMMIVPLDERKPQPLDKSRQLFQRLWTDEDEIELLQGFFEYTSHLRGTHYDTALFYDQIKSKLQLDFNKSQLVEKLRRLKKKYRNVLAKIDSGKDVSFKSPHDQITFEISRKIWSSTGKLAGLEDGNLDEEEGNPNLNSNNNMSNNGGEINQKSTPTPRKRSRPRSLATPPILSRCGGGGSVDGGNLGGKVDNKPVLNDGVASNNGVSNNSHGNVNVGSLIEETVKRCLTPLLKELLSNNAMAGGGGRGIEGLAMKAMPLNFEGVEMVGDDKWRKQQILELEVYSKRLELVQDQIRSQLEELRSIR